MSSDDRSDELAALLALDALGADEQADAELRLGPFVADLAPVTAAMAEAMSAAPPDDLRAATLASAHRRRMPGAPTGRPVAPNRNDALVATIDDLRALLDDLSPAESEIVVPGPLGRVHDVVSHLVAVEELALGWTGAGPAHDPQTLMDHIDSTRGRVGELADERWTDVVAQWHNTALQAADACRAAPPDQAVQAHDLPTTVEGLVLLRIFELWAHAIDIAAATGRRRPELDAARLVLMSQALVDALPLGIALQGHTAPDTTVRLVLTGPAGGTYDISLSGIIGDDSEPAATIVTDVTDLCLVATRRLHPDDLAADIDGDRSVLPLVLSGAAAFARD